MMKKKSMPPKGAAKAAGHKLGANRQETAKRQRKLDKNFKQSRDVREDRGVRQLKTESKNQRQKGS